MFDVYLNDRRDLLVVRKGLSIGGPDDPSFVIALCPNCHRRVHAGQDGEGYNSNLRVAMKAIEPT
jgi:5-methylcytosine-specific restriction enzyme A